MRRAFAALCLIVPVLVACSGSTVSTSSPEVTPTPVATSTSTPQPVAETTPAPATTPEPADTPNPDEPVTYKAGDVVTVTSNGEDWANIVVDKVSQHAKYEGGYFDDTPKKGNIFIEARVTYTALQDGVDYNPFDWQVFVAGEAADNTAFVTNGPDPELNSGTLPKGRKASGWVVYEVPKAGRVLMSYGNTFSNDAPVFEVVIRAK